MARASRMNRMVQVPVKWVASSKGSGWSAPDRQRQNSHSAGATVPASTSALSGENRPVRSVHGVTHSPSKDPTKWIRTPGLATGAADHTFSHGRGLGGSGSLTERARLRIPDAQELGLDI